MRMDWSLGHYETTAEQLSPVSAAVVERAGVSPGDRVVDVGYGTGNAALLAALRGAQSYVSAGASSQSVANAVEGDIIQLYNSRDQKNPC
jgi:tRNA A58 N-methylase Trm61